MSSLRNSFKLVIVSGVPGVGKTTVLRELERIATERYRGKILVVNFGDYMLKAAMEAGLVNDRDQLRRMKLRDQVSLQKRAAEMIIEMGSSLCKDDALIVDTHTVVKTATGYWPGLPFHVVETLKPDAIVLIEASPETVAERRMKDKTRNRADLGGVEETRKLIEYARIAAFASAVRVGSTVAMVENPEGHPEQAAEKIIEIIEKI